jgi:hypothetical protein
MFYEKEHYFQGDSYLRQHNVALVTGVKRNPNGTLSTEWVNYNHDLLAYYNSIAQHQTITHVNAYDYSSNMTIQYTQALINAMNSGVGLVSIFNLGNGSALYDISTTQWKNGLTNDRKSVSFGVFISDGAGALDGVSLAKEMINFSDKKGFVAILAPARSANMSIHPLTDMPKGYQCYIAEAIYRNFSTVAGECVLEAKLRVGSEKYRYNLLGDPALNITATGYEVTRDVVLEAFTEISSWIKVYANVTVPDNGTIFIKDNGQLALYNKTTTLGTNTVIAGTASTDGNPRLYVGVDAKLLGSVSSLVKDIPVYIRGEMVKDIPHYSSRELKNWV